MRRSIINDVSVQELFDVSGLKPWDINWILDIKDLWQGSSPVSAPLLSLAHAFNLDYAESIVLGKMLRVCTSTKSTKRLLTDVKSMFAYVTIF